MHSMRLFTWLIALFAIIIGNAFGDQLQIVAFGTSFTSGKGVSRSDAWPAKLEANLKAEGLSVHVSNEGVNGDTTRDLKRRLAKAVPEGTSIVILEYAVGNDNRAGITIEETVRNVDDIVSQFGIEKDTSFVSDAGKEFRRACAQSRTIQRYHFQIWNFVNRH